MNYLFIVTESRSANGICTKAIMERLAESHCVYCITNREDGQGPAYQQGSVQYYTVRPRLVYSMASRLAQRDAPSARAKAERVALFIINKLKLILTAPIWPLISPLYANRLYRTARSVCRKQSIDCIVPVYTQIDTLIAACRIKKRFRSIQYVPYFLDSLSGGYGPRYFTKDWIRRQGLRWEHLLLPEADHIIAMESSRRHHRAYSSRMVYYDRIHFLDLPLLTAPNPEAALGPDLMDPHQINLVYVGTLPNGIRSPEYVLKVFSHIRDQRWQLYFVGEDGHEKLNFAARQDPRIHVIGRVSHETALRYEAQASALVNIGNRNPNMVPSKIFEYFSWGKPIVSTAASGDEPSIPYLRRYPRVLILDETAPDPGAEAERLVAFIDAARGASICPSVIQKEFYSNTPEATVAFLQEIR